MFSRGLKIGRFPQPDPTKLIARLFRFPLFLLVLPFFGEAQPKTNPPRFAEAAIKPASVNEAAQQFPLDGNSIHLPLMSLRSLISLAYKVPGYAIVAPPGYRCQRYDVMARLPSGASHGQIPDMLQTLLRERFQLIAHRENQEQKVFMIEIGEHGLNITSHAPADDANDGGAIMAGPPPTQALPGTGAVVADQRIRFSGKQMTIGSLAAKLSSLCGCAILDGTQLQGRYTIEFEVSTLDTRAMSMPDSAFAPDSCEGNESGSEGATPGRSIFEALSKMGLKLEPREVALDVLIVTSATAHPLDN
jgi:uncharacterized protein (TIGR03435 family)